MPDIDINFEIELKFVFNYRKFLPEFFGARFNAAVHVTYAFSTEIISVVRGLKEII
jgi:hypothetical protein